MGVLGNPDLVPSCTQELGRHASSKRAGSHPSSPTPPIPSPAVLFVGVVVAVAALALLACVCWVRRRRRALAAGSPPPPLPGESSCGPGCCSACLPCVSGALR